MNILKSAQFNITKDAFFYSFYAQAKQQEYPILLESGQFGKETIAAWNPLAVVQSTEKGLQISWRNGQQEERLGEPLALVEMLLEKYPVKEGYGSFCGGALGFITYDYVRKIERIQNIAKDDLQVPDLYFYIVDHWAVLNVETEIAQVMKLESCDVDIERLAQVWQSSVQEGLQMRRFEKETAVSVKNDASRLKSMSKEAFEAAVYKIQEYIAAGDVFQVNLSVRQEEKTAATPFEIYEALRTFNPSPYMAFMQTPKFAVVCGSPELLIEKFGDELATRPIAGTRPRGNSDAEDLRLAKELIDNEKERAEHLMLVDLERNDLGRVSTYGTVHVDEFMVIEKYSHVQHIVSNVRGIARADQTNAEIIRAVFPGGTITGAPKIRTMEIIEELEPVRRGLYTGSIGWIGFNGDIVLNIVIRTAYIQGEIAYIQAGAGIVIDSIAEKEYVESLNKAKAMWQAKQMAEVQHDFND